MSINTCFPSFPYFSGFLPCSKSIFCYIRDTIQLQHTLISITFFLKKRICHIKFAQVEQSINKLHITYQQDELVLNSACHTLEIKGKTAPSIFSINRKDLMQRSVRWQISILKKPLSFQMIFVDFSNSYLMVLIWSLLFGHNRQAI